MTRGDLVDFLNKMFVPRHEKYFVFKETDHDEVWIVEKYSVSIFDYPRYVELVWFVHNPGSGVRQRPVLLEEVLDNVSNEMKDILLFNLDVFLKKHKQFF